MHCMALAGHLIADLGPAEWDYMRAAGTVVRSAGRRWHRWGDSQPDRWRALEHGRTERGAAGRKPGFLTAYRRAAGYVEGSLEKGDMEGRQRS